MHSQRKKSQTDVFSSHTFTVYRRWWPSSFGHQSKKSKTTLRGSSSTATPWPASVGRENNQGVSSFLQPYWYGLSFGTFSSSHLDYRRQRTREKGEGAMWILSQEECQGWNSIHGRSTISKVGLQLSCIQSDFKWPVRPLWSQNIAKLHQEGMGYPLHVPHYSCDLCYSRRVTVHWASNSHIASIHRPLF